jgi:hypothetical protein
MIEYLLLQDPQLKQKLEENYPWTGIYRLHCLSSDMKSFIPIERILKTDLDGVLYIGTSAYLPNRIDDLKVSITEALTSEPRPSPLFRHTCGKKFKNIGVQQKFPIEKLCIQIIPADKEIDPDNHYILENQEIAKYEGEFGEPPPLNEGRKAY